MRALQQTIAGITVLGYIVLAVFGLFAMSTVHHHSMSSISNCPFMVGEQSLCTMSYTDHIAAWQTLTHAPTVEILTMIFPVLIIFFGLSLHPPNPGRSRRHTPYRERFITTLFSQGILHPKAP